MSFDTIAIVASCALVGLGARLGMRRFVLLAAVATAGSLVALIAGPGVSDGLAMLGGVDTLLSVTAGYVFAYVVGFAGAAALALRKWPRSAGAISSGIPSRAARVRGAVFALLPAVALVWIVRGELPRKGLAPNALGAADASPSIDVLRPIAVVRACKILCELDSAEAERLASRPEVRAVVESPSLERLFRRPGLVREFAAAADGDWKAFTALAVDPTVKSAMNDSEFLRRVQAVDIVALASEIEARRRGEAPPVDDVAAVQRHLPAYAENAELRRRLVEEWSGEVSSGEHAAAALPTADPLTPAEEQARYWHKVELGLHALGAGMRVLP